MSEHPYRLRRISAQNFKSIESVDITLRPLTLIVGANSSGKSTLLQAFLAMAQASRASSPEPSFPLNGEYRRFGTYDETHRFEANTATEPMRLAVELAPGPLSESLSAFATSEDDIEGGYIEWELYLVPGKPESRGQAAIARVSIGLYSDEIDHGKRTILMTDLLVEGGDSTASEHDADATNSGAADPAYLDVPGIRVEGSYFGETDGFTELNANTTHVEWRGCKPRVVAIRRELWRTLARRWWDMLELRFPLRFRSPKTSEKALEVTENEAKNIVNVFVKYIRQIEDRKSDASSIARRRLRPTMLVRLTLDRALSELSASLESKPRKKRLVDIDFGAFVSRVDAQLDASNSARSKVVDPIETDWSFLNLASICDNVDAYMGEDVIYLGPLRKAPQVLFDPQVRELELGASGEYTAAILHAYKDRRVVPIGEEALSERIRLESAVNSWLSRFGLAENVLLEDLGRLGIGLQLVPVDNDHHLDLTSVGVGASQILPVIVSCLLCEPGQLVVLEQPELHLHPRLQQQLGEFLLLCARSGRQVLVETHSEHLINRVRRRIAEDVSYGQDPEESEEYVQLLFAEQIDGTTHIRTSGVDFYGGVELAWPSSFFGVGASDAQALLAASLARRERPDTGR